MKLKLDENLGRRCVEIFRQADHDVSTVFEQGLSGVSDGTLLEVCRSEGRCIVTLDLDFSNPLLFNPSDFSGIAVLRLPQRPGPQDLLDTVYTLIGGLKKEAISGKLWIIQKGRIREYQSKESDG